MRMNSTFEFEDGICGQKSGQGESWAKNGGGNNTAIALFD